MGSGGPCCICGSMKLCGGPISENEQALLEQLAQRAADLAKAEEARSSLLAFCRARVAQCLEMDERGAGQDGTFRQGRVAAFLAVIHKLDSASMVKPLTSGMAEPDGNSFDFLANRPVKP